MNSNDKVALVTGAGTGIGKAVALALLAAGYRVVLAGRRIEPLEEVARAAGRDRILPVATDVSRPESAWTCCSIMPASIRRAPGLKT